MEAAPREVEMTKDKDEMKEPTNAEELRVLHDILRVDPQRYLRIVNGWIEQNPENSHAYFDRHSSRISFLNRFQVWLNSSIFCKDSFLLSLKQKAKSLKKKIRH